MTTAQLVFICLLLISFGFFCFTMAGVIRSFRFTKGTDRIEQIPRRLMTTLKVAIGQSKILRKPVAGILHAMMWWGFLVITVGTLEMIIDGLVGTARALSITGILYDVLTSSGEVLAAVIVVACIIYLIRRFIFIPKRFVAPEMKVSSKWDATAILLLILVLMFSLIGMNFGYVGSHMAQYEGVYPISKLLHAVLGANAQWNYADIEHWNWWIHITLVLAFLNILPYSKHFHVIMSVPNVFLSRLSPMSALDNMSSVTNEVRLMLGEEIENVGAEDQQDIGRFGVKDIEDTSWKNLLDAYTCTECGRCTDVCPANITGKKLSPRKLYVDLRARMKEKLPGLKNNQGSYEDGKSLLGDYISAEELWACTSCMACVQECPVNIDHVPFIVDMRRNLVMEESKAPAEITAMFNNIENNGAPWQFSNEDRMKWTENLSLKTNNALS